MKSVLRQMVLGAEKVLLRNKWFHGIEHWILQKKRKKDVLLIVHNQVMAGHLVHYARILKQDARFRLWISFPRLDLVSRADRKRIARQLEGPVVPFVLAKRVLWDLALYADHCPFVRGDVKKIYVSHGLSVLPKNGRDIYGFSEGYTIDETGGLIYERMFVASDFGQRQGLRQNPKLGDSIRIVGACMRDRIAAAGSKGLDQPKDPQKPTVFFVSTWGRFSLLQKQWDVLVPQFSDLAKTYRILFSAHPNNFIGSGRNGVGWRAKLLDAQEQGFIQVVDNSMDLLLGGMVPDVIVTDHSTLHYYCLCLKKPIVFLEFANGPCEDGSDPLLVEAYRDFVKDRVSPYALCVPNLDDVGQTVRCAIAEHSVERMQQAESHFFAFPGQSSQRVYEEICDVLNMRPALEF